jgi:hypothetical protein
LGVLVVVASAFTETQDAFIAGEVDFIRDKGYNFVITRHYDCTPIRVRFGSLQDRVMPHARYSYFDKDLDKWVQLSLPEYLSKGPSPHLIRFGTCL